MGPRLGRCAFLAAVALLSLTTCNRGTPQLEGSVCGDCPDEALCDCDEHDRVLEARFDYNSDGTVDSVVRYERDASGFVVRRELDDQNNGVVNEVRHYEPDEQGRISVERVDMHGNDSIDEIYHRAYDANGSLVTRSEDFDDDGSPERVCTYSPPCPPPYVLRECEADCDVPRD